MKREEYIECRNSGKFNIDFIYSHYVENFDSKKHKPFLKKEEFFGILQILPPINIHSLIEEYDEKFNIVTFTDKNGNIIKYM